MSEADFCFDITSLSGDIQYIDCLTCEAMPNSEFEVHSHFSEFEIYWFVEGVLDFSFEGERIAVQPNDIIIISNNCLHRPIIKEKCLYHRRRILFSTALFSKSPVGAHELFKQLLNKKLLRFSGNVLIKDELDRLFTDVKQELEKRTPYNDFCAVINLFSFLIKANTQTVSASGLPALDGGGACEIISYIEDNLNNRLDYKTIASQLNLSEKSLYKSFKRETGYSLGKYIKERRIVKAKALLSAGASASDTALAVGFNDYSVFYRCFIKEVGVSPQSFLSALRSDKR